MFKKIAFISLLTLPLTSTALELRYGYGDFEMGANALNLLQTRVKLDTNTITLAEPHKNIRNTKFYYHFKLDYFDSDTLNQITDLASTPLQTSLPFYGQSVTDFIDDFTTIPTPVDYRLHGIDLNMGVGYDLVSDKKMTLGLGVNTGISTPFMKTRHPVSDIGFIIDLLDTFDTKVRTYKIGTQAFGRYKLNNQLSMSGTASLSGQIGSIENGIIHSGFDVTGTNKTLDLNLRFQPAQLKKLHITAGYAYDRWDVDSSTVTVPIQSFDVPGVMDYDFTSSKLYLGLGIDL